MRRLSLLHDSFRHAPRTLQLVWRSSPGTTLLMGLFTLAAAGLPLLIAFAGKAIVDAVVAGSARDTLEWVLIELGLVALQALVIRGGGLLRQVLGARLGVDINLMILDKAQGLTLSHFEDADFYDQLTRARREASSRPVQVVTESFQLIQNLLTLVGYAAVLVALSWWVVLALLVAALPATISEMRYSTAAFRLRNWRSPDSRRLMYLEYVLANDSHVKEVKLFGLGPMLLDRYRSLAEKFYREDTALATRRAGWGYVLSLLATSAFYGSYAFMAVRTAQGALTLGQMTLYVVAFRQGQQAFQSCLTAVGGMFEHNLYMSNLFAYLDIDPESVLSKPASKSAESDPKESDPTEPKSADSGPKDSDPTESQSTESNTEASNPALSKPGLPTPPQPSAAQLYAISAHDGEANESRAVSARSVSAQGVSAQNVPALVVTGRTVLDDEALPPLSANEKGIRFENLGFRYPNQERWALRNLNLFIPAGQSVALVGHNGAGKTTLIKLLTRLYDPSEGRILLDGQDLRNWEPEALLQRFGVVFQDFNQYQFKLRENVGVGSIAHFEDDSRVLRAVERGGAESVVSALAEGLDTPLGRWFKDGTELSGGQWQKIALSRAFMREEADILILDEPTAALDAEAEAQIFDRFRHLAEGRTTLLISHRFSTVRMADRILVIEAGRLREDGDHQALMAAGERYAELFSLQAEGYR